MKWHFHQQLLNRDITSCVDGRTGICSCLVCVDLHLQITDVRSRSAAIAECEIIERFKFLSHVHNHYLTQGTLTASF